jgi:hypothetical protein
MRVVDLIDELVGRRLRDAGDQLLGTRNVIALRAR